MHQNCACWAADHTRLAGRGVGLHRAAVAHPGAGFQNNPPAFAAQAIRFQGAAVVHHAAAQLGHGLRGQDDETARGLDGRLVLDQSIDAGSRYPQAGQAAASFKLKLKGLTGGQRHRAQIRQNHAAVAHFGRQQSDVAVQGGTQFTLVHHLARGTLAVELHPAFHEGLVGGVVGGGHQTAHVHGGGFAEIHALRVDQHHLPRRCDAAQNLAGVVVRHPVQGGRLGVGLLKMHLRLTAHIESVPVHHRPLAGLVDGQGVGALADAGLARRHLAAGGQLVVGHGGLRGQRQRQSHPQAEDACQTNK